MQKLKFKSQNYNSKFKIILILNLSFLIFNFLGCAPSPYVKPTPPQQALPGVYHKVEKNQTLYRISKLYNIDLDELVRANKIQDAAFLKEGQLIFIPNRQKEEHPAAKYSNDDFIWPIKGSVILSFGQSFNNMVNKGINIAPTGSPDVLAMRSGKVIFYADNFGSFGKTIIIDHGDGLSTVYARNQDVFIKPGEWVKKGSVIAKAGSAGRDKDIYLHFEIRRSGAPQNPYYYLP